MIETVLTAINSTTTISSTATVGVADGEREAGEGEEEEETGLRMNPTLRTETVTEDTRACLAILTWTGALSATTLIPQYRLPRLRRICQEEEEEVVVEEERAAKW